MAWTDKYVSVAGGGAHDGTSEANAWTLAEAIAAPYAAGQRINVKAGTYANTTTSRTFAVAGTTTAPIWWRGYKASIGDLDDGVTTARSLQDGVNLPLITFTTGQMTLSGAHNIFSNLDVTSQCTTLGGAVIASGGQCAFVGFRVENTAANTAARALTSQTNIGNRFIRCRFKVNATANFCFYHTSSGQAYGCYIIGGATAGIYTNATYQLGVCVVESFTGIGLSFDGATQNFFVNNCTIYAAATTGINFTATLTTGVALIANTIIGGCTNGINSLAASNGIAQFRNHFYSCTNNLVNITEMATYDADLGILYCLLDDDNDPFVAKASGDFSLASGAVDRSAGLPGIFEGQTAMVGYPDIGAVRHIDPTAGGGLRLAGHGGLAA